MRITQPRTSHLVEPYTEDLTILGKGQVHKSITKPNNIRSQPNHKLDGYSSDHLFTSILVERNGRTQIFEVNLTKVDDLQTGAAFVTEERDELTAF